MNSKSRLTITADDPYQQLKNAKPGRYRIMDTLRGRVEDVEVKGDGSYTIINSTPDPSIKIPLTPGVHAADADLIPRGPFEFQEVRVGELYAPGRTSWPEGSTVYIGPSGISHVQFYNEPTTTEIKSFQEGRISVRLLVDTHTMMFLFRYGDHNNWCEASYSVHRVIAAHRIEAAVCPPDPGEGHTWMVHGIVVDAATGKVIALRQYGLSRRFSVACLRQYEAQKARGPNDLLHIRQVQRFQRKSTETLAGDAVDRFEQGETRS